MIRVGIGYDIHRLVPGRRLILGGVEIDHVMGLAGHSDADVITHALMDALLGAAALDDIGVHFPPEEDRFRNVSSLELLATVRDMLARAGFRILNADIVVVAEKPRISTHAALMRERLGRTLGIDPSHIGLKATTNEEVGPEGRQEAISARAVALVETGA